jgi:hypothetical protein
MLRHPSRSAPFGVQMEWTLEWFYNHYSDFNHPDMFLLTESYSYSCGAGLQWLCHWSLRMVTSLIHDIAWDQVVLVLTLAQTEGCTFFCKTTFIVYKKINCDIDILISTELSVIFVIWISKQFCCHWEIIEIFGIYSFCECLSVGL